jgi:hypothetical protein
MRSCAIAQFCKSYQSCPMLAPTAFVKLQDRDKRRHVEERSYRQSRLCRVFGNPVALATRFKVQGFRFKVSVGLNAQTGRDFGRLSHPSAQAAARSETGEVAPRRDTD